MFEWMLDETMLTFVECFTSLGDSNTSILHHIQLTECSYIITLCGTPKPEMLVSLSEAQMHLGVLRFFLD